MKLKIAQVVGLNTDQKAAQVTSSVRNGGDTFLAVLELSCDDAFTKGRQVLSELEDFYFESEGGPAEKLNATFKEAEEKISQESDFNLNLAAVSGKVLYLIGKGQVEVYLKRADKLSSLLPAGMPSQLISGFLQEGDRLLFSTRSLVAFLGDELQKSLSLPVEIFKEEVESRIGASDLENQGLAALAVETLGEDLEISSLPQEEEQPDRDYEAIAKPGINLRAVLDKAAGLAGRLRTYFPRSGRGRLAVAVILIAVTILGAGYKYKLSRDKQRNLQFNQILQQAKDDFNSAKGLAGLNPPEAKNKLDSAKDQVNKALAIKSRDSGAQNLKKQIEEQSPSILQETSISEFPVFLDMDLVKKDFRAAYLSLSAGKLLLLDQGAKTLVTVDLAKKSNQILAGENQLGEAVFASLNGGTAFVYSVDKGILRVDIANQKVTSVSKKDSGWKEIKDIYGFAGNVYLLDSRQVWKYLPTVDGYSDKREYLTKASEADFGSALRMQIESSVYVLKTGGEIVRFTRGDKDNFSYAGLDKGVKDPKSVFASSDADNLYVLDSGNSRLLILTKTGSYKGQIAGSKFATASDLAVDEKNKKVYLLDSSKIYSVDLK